MSALGVRRGKAAFFSGCKSHPAIAPAGSNWSSHGGNEMAEAFGYLCPGPRPGERQVMKTAIYDMMAESEEYIARVGATRADDKAARLRSMHDAGVRPAASGEGRHGERS